MICAFSFCYFAKESLYMFIANKEHDGREFALLSQRGEREMYENEEQNEVIEFCLKHDLIRKTDQGYIIKKEFFEILDYFEI
jgi:hypothetical protein